MDVWLYVVLPSGCIDQDDIIKAELLTAGQLQLSISWSPALVDANSMHFVMM